MRGRSCTQPFLVEGGTCRLDAFLFLLRWVSRSPPHPPQCAHWGTYGLWWLRLDLTEQSPGLFDPRGEGFGREKSPVGYTTPSAPPTRPGGHASQSSAGRSRRKRIKSCFDRLRRPKHTSQPPVCPQGARSGCNPPILGGASHQADYLTPPYATAPNEAPTSLAPPKILTVRKSASPPDPPASAAPPQPGGSGPGSGPGSRWLSGPGGRRGPRCWSFSRSSPGPLGWTGWS